MEVATMFFSLLFCHWWCIVDTALLNWKMNKNKKHNAEENLYKSNKYSCKCCSNLCILLVYHLSQVHSFFVTPSALLYTLTSRSLVYCWPQHSPFGRPVTEVFWQLGVSIAPSVPLSLPSAFSFLFSTLCKHFPSIYCTALSYRHFPLSSGL